MDRMTKATAMLLALGMSAGLLGCSKDDFRPPPPEAKPIPTLSAATQGDLAKEIDQAVQVGTWQELKHRWQGQRLRWTVTRHAILCQRDDSCNVAAFAIDVKEHGAKQGWLPALSFAPGEMAKLQAACGAKDCDFTFEGTLDELRGSEAEPAAVHFKDVTVIKV